MEEELIIKILFVGDSSAGKGEIMGQYFGEPVDEKIQSTIGLDFKVKCLNIDGKKIKVQVWDTIGQEQYRTITKSFLRGADGVFLTFDYTRVDTFQMLGDWMDSIKENNVYNADIFLIGNNCDQDKVVSEDAVLKFKAKYDLPLFNLSGKTGLNVEETFLEAIKVIKERKEREAKEIEEKEREEKEREAQAQDTEEKKHKNGTKKEACNIY
ncbi:Ras-related protein Rab-8A [Histomonas meleagridis]|uniref:Ras-related protein Rab-8A n=1 Tax=Histomonas meleagridis TaxID=135588 RepID=UPI00355A653E|nr:Ras-related protein Rab-8A [Histomonas meleagridis]KAH0800407.1 Ras-related protein Rab-8A [Histomonas meleagridis]